MIKINTERMDRMNFLAKFRVFRGGVVMTNHNTLKSGGMGKLIKFIDKLIHDESGQAVLEYVLAVSLAVSFVIVITTVFRRSLINLWFSMTRDITAGCPGCVPDPSIR